MPHVPQWAGGGIPSALGDARQAHGATRHPSPLESTNLSLPLCPSYSVSPIVYMLPSVSDVALSLSVYLSLSVCFPLSSDIWLESGSQPGDGVGVEVVDLGLVSPGRWSSHSSQLAFFEARTG